MALKASTQERLGSPPAGETRGGLGAGAEGDSVGHVEQKVAGSQALKTPRSSV